MDIPRVLQVATEKLGYSSLKTKQKEAIIAFIKRQDVFVALPTGSGKSVCYYALPLVFDMIHNKSEDSKSIAIIISPLNALIKDQVSSLSEKGLCGMHVTGTLGENIVDQIQEGRIHYLFFSPETLLGASIDTWRDMLQTDVYQDRVVAIVADEAHLVQKWGNSFRREFSHLGELRSLLPSVKLMALTATATKRTRKEICRTLGMESAHVISQSPDRPNIVFEMDSTTADVEIAFLPLLENIKSKRQHTERTIIVFCRTYDSCTLIYHFFRSALGCDLTEPRACTQPDVKEILLKQFREPNSCLRVIIATVAFGLGLDCPNVRHVIHWGFAPDVESYMQESGRAGRDGAPATAKMFSAVKDGIVFSDESMKAYCTLKVGECRRKFLLSHFDENHETSFDVSCKCCDNCRPLCLCELCFSST